MFTEIKRLWNCFGQVNFVSPKKHGEFKRSDGGIHENPTEKKMNG